MKLLYLVFAMTLIFYARTSVASDIYMNGNRVVLALEAIHGVGAGVGNKTCLLCHASSSGGPGNINTGFGQDFVDAALDVVGTRGGNSLPATGPNSLESIFSDSDFAALDSDGDGDSNAVEFAANQDPADDVTEGNTSGAGGGGCGIVLPPQGPSIFPPFTGLLLLVPLGFLVIFRFKRV